MPPRKLMTCEPPCEELKEAQLISKFMQEKMDNFEKKLDAVLTKLDGMDEKMERKYSAKWVENAMTGFIVVLVLAALYTIIEKAGMSIH